MSLCVSTRDQTNKAVCRPRGCSRNPRLVEKVAVLLVDPSKTIETRNLIHTTHKHIKKTGVQSFGKVTLRAASFQILPRHLFFCISSRFPGLRSFLISEVEKQSADRALLYVIIQQFTVKINTGRGIILNVRKVTVFNFEVDSLEVEYPGTHIFKSFFY